MTKVLTILEHEDEEVLRNHQRYAQLYGYQHLWVEDDFLPHEELRVAYKYSYLLQQLKLCDEGELILLLDGHTAIFKPISIVDAMVGHDSFVCYGSQSQNTPNARLLPLNNLLIVRNTVTNRTRLHEMLNDLHTRLSGQIDHLSEYGWLEKFSIQPTNAALIGAYINVNWQISNWFNANIFAVNLGLGTRYNEEGQLTEELTHDYNLERMILRQINSHFIDGKPMMEAPSYPVISEDSESHFNFESRIAFVTLYTHHITRYARISESNIKRYCDRHGYAYHVYRALPEEVGSDVMGSWVKTLLLKKHIAHHDWVIWVDADVLIHNQNKKIELLLEGRDLIFARDLCAWQVNSGIMGFRNTAKNVELVGKLWQRMVEVKDKSTVYSEMGDQHHTINVLEENGILKEEHILNCLDINTPPPMTSSDTFLTHYVGWGEPYRSIYMAHDDALTQRQG